MSKEDENANFKEVISRLDAIIRILLRQSQIEEMNTGEQILILNSAGLSDSDIAKIIGKTRNYTSSVITKKGKRGKK